MRKGSKEKGTERKGDRNKEKAQNTEKVGICDLSVPPMFHIYFTN